VEVTAPSNASEAMAASNRTLEVVVFIMWLVLCCAVPAGAARKEKQPLCQLLESSLQ